MILLQNKVVGHRNRTDVHFRPAQRSLYDLGIISYYQVDYQSAQIYFQQAKEIYHGLGYRLGEIGCLFMFGTLHGVLGDHEAARERYEQGLARSRATGWRTAEAHALSNLGIIHYDLGDYQGAHSYLQQALAACLEIEDIGTNANGLDTLSLVCLALGKDEAAQEHSSQALAIQRQIGDRRGEGYSQSHLGQILIGQDDLLGAKEAYSQALKLRRELGQNGLMMDDLAGLARIALAQENPAQALAYVEEILAWIEANGIEGIELPALVYLTCYRVLQAASWNDPAARIRAEDVLRESYRLVHERAAKIRDEETRRSFLENVVTHREIMNEYRGQETG